VPERAHGYGTTPCPVTNPGRPAVLLLLSRPHRRSLIRLSALGTFFALILAAASASPAAQAANYTWSGGGSGATA